MIVFLVASFFLNKSSCLFKQNSQSNVYNLKMNSKRLPKDQASSLAIVQFSMNAPQIQREEKVSEINDIRLSPIEDKASDGAQTTTPARPGIVVPDQQANPQDMNKAKNEKNQPKSMKKYIIIISIVLGVALIGTIITIVTLLNRPRFQSVVVKNYVSVPMASSSSQGVNTKVVQVKDPETFKSQTPIDVYASKTTVKPSQSTSGKRLLQQTNTYTTYTIYDKILNCGVTISSTGFQMSLLVDVSRLLEFVFSSQPPKQESTTDNLQPNVPIQTKPQTTVYNYISIGDKISKKVKEILFKQDPKAKAIQTNSLNLQFSKQINAFQIVTSSQSSNAQTAILFDSSKVKIIKDFNNQDELTDAASQVIYGALKKAKQFFQKRYNELKKTTGIELASNDTTFGQTSIYLNEASDFEKECVPSSDKTTKCDIKVVKNGAINVQQQDQKQNQVSSDIKVFADF